MARVSIPTVQNLVLRSEQFANAAWTKNTGVTATDNTSDVTDPNGGSTAAKMVYDGSGGAGAFRWFQAVGSTFAGRFNTAGMWLRTLSGTKTLRITSNVTGVLASCSITSTWTQFTEGFLAASDGTVQCAIYDDVAANSAFTVYAWGGQVTQSNRIGLYVQTVGSAVNNGPIRCSP